ncbi:MAG: dicarboxylate/amino acid:cation symporter, partial [Selenomonadaceae bacterium]|nr:dicarboxylate/amino acid:cation symporter [Selenomonadaceae bacterium]
IYTLTTLIASFLSVVIGAFIFGGDVPQLGVIGGETGEAASFSLLSMLVGIVPKNLVNPIVNGEMLQVIFVAVIFGICINKLGDKVKILHDFIDAMNNFCLRMITMIVTFIPFIAFLSMASLVINVGLDSVLILGKLVMGQLGGSLIMVGVYLLILLVIGRITPIPFLKKIPSFVPIPLSTCSSNATMPFTLKFCSEKMGISQKLSSFSIPVGATVNMDGGCFYLSIASIMLARMYGVELDFDVLFTVFVTVVALSIGAPGVPGGAFVCLASIVAALGLPVEATAIVLGIDPICSMLRTALNATGDIAATTALAKNEDLIDEDIYRKV